MTDYEIIMIFIEILIMLIAFGKLIITLLTYFIKTDKSSSETSQK